MTAPAPRSRESGFGPHGRLGGMLAASVIAVAAVPDLAALQTAGEIGALWVGVAATVAAIACAIAAGIVTNDDGIGCATALIGLLGRGAGALVAHLAELEGTAGVKAKLAGTVGLPILALVAQLITNWWQDRDT